MHPAPDSLQYLLDRQAVVDTVIRYATGVDRRDWALYRTVFTDPCEFDFSSWSGRPASTMPADAWVAAVRGTNGGFDATQHLSCNHVVTWNSADEAVCVSEMHAQHWFSPESMASWGHPGGVNFCTLGGHYTNTVVRTDEGWKIRRCQLEVVWITGDRHIFDFARIRMQQVDGKA
jgi:hypothetical protein